MSDLPHSPADFKIDEIADDITKVLADIGWQTWGTAALYIFFGFIIASFTSTIASKVISKHTSAHYTQIIRRLLYYGIIIVSIIIALTTLQLNMKVLGIATVLTLAIGFASQTAVSNIISGLFLVFERPFLVGDFLDFSGIEGELLAIDLLSIKIRTFDNTLVRVPNEMLLKTQFVNMTKFPIRRLDIKIQVRLNEDIDKIRKILFDLARKNPMVLESPPPQIQFEEFNEKSMVFFYCVWLKKEVFYTLKHQVPFDLQQAFREHGIKMPTMSFQLENEGSV
jgi:small-conductance mechanosensitive channel